jgi:hypothetical protein
VQDLGGKPLNPLILDKEWWEKTYSSKMSKFHAGAKRVLINIAEGEHDYSSTMELLHQSNPHALEVVLEWPPRSRVY